jgi:aarF domain-containing kinase
VKRSLPTDIWGRSTRVFALAARLARHELTHQIVKAGLSSSLERLGSSEVRTRVAQARLVAESLGRLKGAFMKAGQLLSLDAGDFLPPEALEILSKLQGQADPIDFSVMAGVLESELGPERLAELTEIDPSPAASASIGQVHRARAFGEPVAVKIQYPGVADSIDADIALLEKLSSSWLALTRREIDLSDTFAELGAILHLEADYERERRYQQRFEALLASDPRFAVPRAVAALSTSKVLTMSWAEGVTLEAWLRSRPPRGEREALGRALLDLYCMEFFRWGTVQTDPNLGNFLVQRRGRIVLLDFGATVEYDAAFREGYVSLLRCIATNNRQRIADEGVAFGLLDARESPKTRARFVDMLVSSVEPFEPRRQPFAFRDADYAVRSRVVVREFVQSLQFSSPPHRLIFLHRKLGGIFQLLKRLDLELDLSRYWEQMVAVVGAFEQQRTPNDLNRSFPLT